MEPVLLEALGFPTDTLQLCQARLWDRFACSPVVLAQRSLLRGPHADPCGEGVMDVIQPHKVTQGLGSSVLTQGTFLPAELLRAFS